MQNDRGGGENGENSGIDTGLYSVLQRVDGIICRREVDCNNGKIGVIDVGGGSAGIYAAGVFDWCLENGVKFDYGIGISAGSANVASI